jgi:hypothetical protein
VELQERLKFPMVILIRALISPQKIYRNTASKVLSIVSEHKGFASKTMDSPAKDSLSPVTVGVSPAKGVVLPAKSIFSPVKCGHLLAKVGLLLVRAFFASEKLLIISANTVHSKPVFGHQTVHSFVVLCVLVLNLVTLIQYQ